jgi:hypothetical protein
MTLFVDKFATDSFLLDHTAYSFLFRQKLPGYLLTLIGFQWSGKGRSLIHAFFEEIRR